MKKNLLFISKQGEYYAGIINTNAHNQQQENKFSLKVSITVHKLRPNVIHPLYLDNDL